MAPSNLPLPKHWRDHVRSGALHAISLASAALTHAWSRAAESTSGRRQQAELDRLRAEVSFLEEEMAIKDSRWGRHSPRRRPHYGPIQRMRILQLRAARGWTVSETADRFLLTEATIMNWMRRLDDGGERALVETPEPVNRYPDFVAYLVRHLKALAPSLGKKRIADMLARAGLHVSTSTVGRMLKRDLSKGDDESVAVVRKGRLSARRPNDVWHVDLTTVPTGAGFWTPWFPFTNFQRWPFCWWVAVCVDHASRALVGLAVFKKRPTAKDVGAFLDRAIRRAGSKPRYIISDHGKEFDCRAHKRWCRGRGIRPRFGAIGEHGSITVVERFIRSLKTECTRRILVPFRARVMRRELSHYASWYNEHRPHSGLGGRTPTEIYRGGSPAIEAGRFEPRARWPRVEKNRRGKRGAQLALVLRHVGGRRHLPIVELKAVA